MSLGNSGGRLTPSATGTWSTCLNRNRSARCPAIVASSPAGSIVTSGVPRSTPRFWSAGNLVPRLVGGIQDPNGRVSHLLKDDAPDRQRREPPLHLGARLIARDEVLNVGPALRA
jgi:hypothetical protein